MERSGYHQFMATGPNGWRLPKRDTEIERHERISCLSLLGRTCSRERASAFLAAHRRHAAPCGAPPVLPCCLLCRDERRAPPNKVACSPRVLRICTASPLITIIIAALSSLVSSALDLTAGLVLPWGVSTLTHLIGLKNLFPKGGTEIAFETNGVLTASCCQAKGGHLTHMCLCSLAGAEERRSKRNRAGGERKRYLGVSKAKLSSPKVLCVHLCFFGVLFDLLITIITIAQDPRP